MFTTGNEVHLRVDDGIPEGHELVRTRMYSEDIIELILDANDRPKSITMRSLPKPEPSTAEKD